MQTLLNILAGIALLVWGTHIVRSGMLRVLGGDLRKIIASSVSNRGSAFAAGLGVTALVQSSSATALIVSSFVGQRLMPLAPALAVMLGADVGTSLVVQVFSFDLSWLAPLAIALGVVLHLSRKATRAGQVGRIAIGIGLIITALQMIMAATRPITAAYGADGIFATLAGDPMLDLLLGALLTVLAWSSLSVVLLASAFVAGGVFGLEAGLFLVLGANLGSGMLAMLATSGARPAGRRVAIGNLAFKLAGCLLAVPLIGPIQQALLLVDGDPGRMIVNFHLLFNVMLAVALIGFTGPIARLAQWLLPDETHGARRSEPRHLDAAALQTPALATANAAREALRIADLIETMLEGVLSVIRNNEGRLAREIKRMDDEVDDLYTAIKFYLAKLSREALDEVDSRRWADIISMTINLEHIGDIIGHVIDDLEQKKISRGRSLSPEGMREIEELHRHLMQNLRLGMNVFLSGDEQSARMLLERKAAFRALAHAYTDTHLHRLARHTAESIETSSLHLDIVNDFKRINSHICASAYAVLGRSAAAERAAALAPATRAPAEPPARADELGPISGGA